jgi:hypothetical protein
MRGLPPRSHSMTSTDGRQIAPEALIALEFRGRSFHDPFHGQQSTAARHLTTTRTQRRRSLV